MMAGRILQAYFEAFISFAVVSAPHPTLSSWLSDSCDSLCVDVLFANKQSTELDSMDLAFLR